MNRPKKQGTAAETRIVKLHQEAGIPARRLAEGGSLDLGDVEIQGGIFGEVKDREVLNVQDALEKAVRKAGTHRVALFWTQRRRSRADARRRVSRRLVAIPEELWLELIGGDSSSGS